ncbi:MAG: TonB-dependent receptor plug domain-containing protein, partial [Sphingomonas bacterium]|nr:TonB-dependent receptor plug domain-containing protein [Sphingomonas bacterium]
MTDINRVSTTRTRFIASASAGAIGAALLIASTSAAHAQADTGAGSKVPDPANSSSSAANPNEAVNAEAKKADNAAVTGDVTPAQNEAIAQNVGGAVADATGSAETGDIVVTGFRASLETAVAEKKNRDQIVESISAEDIGKLPDASIAESIARLPGLTSQRVSGRANVISIRGFSPDFST